MTIALEQLADGSVSDRNFHALTRLVLDTGGRSVGIRFGTVSLPFTASATSATAVVTHGLGTTPIGVFYGVADLNVDQVATSALGATTFTAQARYTGSVTGTAVAYWVVIG